MSKTYNNALAHILRAKKDVETRQYNHQRRCHIGAIMCQISIAAEFLDDALTRMENR